MERQRSQTPSLRHAAGVRLVGAVLLGMTTLLGPKADPTEHWATPPRSPVAEVQEDPADPGEGLDAIDVALLLVGTPTR